MPSLGTVAKVRVMLWRTRRGCLEASLRLLYKQTKPAIKIKNFLNKIQGRDGQHRQYNQYFIINLKWIIIYKNIESQIVFLNITL